jgi:predicted nucleic acid-binding protein
MISDRVFLDANVLFSAAYRPDAGICRLWRLDNVRLLTSSYAATEARVNLAEEAQLTRLQQLLQPIEMVSGLAFLPLGVTLPEKDRPILQAAIYGRSTHLLTGDRQHFGKYFGREIGGLWVLLPAACFKQLRR